MRLSFHGSYRGGMASYDCLGGEAAWPSTLHVEHVETVIIARGNTMPLFMSERWLCSPRRACNMSTSDTSGERMACA
jgi:hypothetical protein